MKIKTYADLIDISSGMIDRVDRCDSPMKGEWSVCESWAPASIMDLGWRSVCSFKSLEDAFRAIHRFAPLLGYSMSSADIRGNCCYTRGPRKDNMLSIRMIHPGQDLRLVQEFEV